MSTCSNDTNQSIDHRWNRVCSRIQQADADRFAVRWLSKIVPDGIRDGRLQLLVPSPCIRELIRQNYADRILAFWQEEDTNIEGLDLELAPSAQTELPRSTPAVLKPTPVQPTIRTDSDTPQSVLNPNYTFDRFVVGPSNQFAYAAACKIADDDSIAFNPLYVHGASGLGKTHLMQAIAWRLRERRPDLSVLYLSSEQFFLQFIKALRTPFEGTAHFRDIFRSVDVLMIDDIQFICGKGATQEEFFNTFNYLISHGKKIILSADSAPQALRSVEERLKARPDLAGIADRLKTRIAQGLVVDILPPAYELRLGILQDKARGLTTVVPDDVLDFLARNITSNVRELEGALKRIVAHAELIGGPITIASTRAVLKDLLQLSEKVVGLSEIQYAVCGHYQITLSDLKSNRRERRIARPRQLAMYLAKTLTPLSLPDIGQAFGRDHTTVIHAVRTIENLMCRDSELAGDADLLTRRLKGESV